MNARFLRQWLMIPIVLLGSALLCAAAEVSAELQRDQITTDDLVHLDVTVKGGRLDAVPEPPEIVGLQLLGSSSSRRIEMRNMDISQVVVFSYRYAPQKVGTIAIPPIPLQVEGRTVHTNALTLNVEAGSGGSRHGSSSWQGRSRAPARPPTTANPPGHPSSPVSPDEEQEPPSDERMAYAEWVLPKTSVYVGEAVPAELRLYVANSLKWNLNQYPTITGDGFMMQKLPEKPSSSVVTKDGQRWDMVVFKTALTPVKSGQVTLEPSEFLPIVVMPQRIRRPAPPAGFRDFFNDPFFDDAFGVNVRKQISVKTEPLELEVKPLPQEGKPASFAGAVGRFTLDVNAGPLRVKGGDPVTMTMKISGTGNFERVTAPQVADDMAWQSYPPSSKFEGDDSIGISGEKIFEMALIPSGSDGVEKLLLPEVEFSYFDPVKEGYVVLNGERKEIVVSGGGGKQNEPAPAQTSIAAQPTPAPKAAEPEDIRFIRLDPGSWSVARGPVWKSPLFLGVQGVALLAFVGWCGLAWRRSRPAPGPEARWKEERATALKRARQARTAPEFYDAAAEALTLHAALKTAKTAKGAGEREDLSQAEVVAALGGESIESIVEEIFGTRDRLRYAGDASAPDERVAILQQELAKIIKA